MQFRTGNTFRTLLVSVQSPFLDILFDVLSNSCLIALLKPIWISTANYTDPHFQRKMFQECNFN